MSKKQKSITDTKNTNILQSNIIHTMNIQYQMLYMIFLDLLQALLDN